MLYVHIKSRKFYSKNPKKLYFLCILMKGKKVIFNKLQKLNLIDAFVMTFL